MLTGSTVDPIAGSSPDLAEGLACSVLIVRAAQHTIRARRSAKRTGIVVSLDTPQALTQPADQATDPEASARARELNELINMILAEHGGSRWVEMFQLWLHDDQRSVYIGQRLGLSSSRVRVLLAEARRILQKHPSIAAWREAQDESST